MVFVVFFAHPVDAQKHVRAVSKHSLPLIDFKTHVFQINDFKTRVFEINDFKPFHWVSNSSADQNGAMNY